MTQETIVAVYDTSTHAEAAIRALQEAGVPSSDITHHASETQTSTQGAEFAPRREEPGFWSRLFGTESEEYRQDNAVYGRTVESGGSVVSVRVADVGRDADKVMQILESHNPVDIEERASTFERSETEYAAPQDSRALGVAEAGGGFGTAGTTDTAGLGTAGMSTPARDADRGAYETRETTMRTTTPVEGMDTSRTETLGTGTLGTGAVGTGAVGTGAVGDQVISLAEEQLQVGKRVVNRGTTRVRRYVVETPVEEDITLRNEHVSVDRRPATGGTVAADAFTDKTIEMTETNEEAVVGKSAHVVEEVVIHKEGGDHVETVRDTVRKEQVDIDRDADAGTARRADMDDSTGKRPSGL